VKTMGMVINSDTVEHWRKIEEVLLILRELRDDKFITQPVYVELKEEVYQEIKHIYLKDK